MITNTKIFESVPCEKEYFTISGHKWNYLQPFYIADSFSYLHSLILLKLKQNRSLMRTRSQTIKKIQAITYNLLTWSVVFLIFKQIVCCYRMQSL